MLRLLASLFALGALTACGAEDIRYATPQSVSELRKPSRYASIEVVEVTLPTYAAGESIWIENADGALVELGPLWADDPARAVTLQLTQNLATITRAKVASEPWPFRDYAEVKVDVRLREMRATQAGAFLFSGQYFVAPDEGTRNRAGNFDIQIPIGAPVTAQSIAAARAQAVSTLAEDIARNGL